ncbi:hypothetical protein TSUD_171730 [Trifolium subterraneum]|uniref:Reverse transcriptase zinc-binding domain-containing protein n=1 Tax=Trifolium subterraneum TaxID=3900 RepID=A0A2Z6M734_TRISU|nr:hypothetical protein TSUD_171730 [Trifolium subterraneum]
MPLKVWKHIVKLQRGFLWGGATLGRKIAWVRWDKVCRPKSDGGLGIRDLRVVNLALLGKWRWRLISREQGIWRDIISARYGLLYPSPHFGGRPSGSSVEVGSDWFSKGVLKRVGDEGSSSFWFDPWVGDIPLKIQFQSLFQLSDQQLDLVGEMGYRLDLEWHWVFRWRGDLSILEIGLLEALLSAVQTTPLLGVVDSWSWRHDSTGTYSVKSAYMVLSAGSVASDLDSLLALVWKSWAPSKVIVFS